jgi:RsiW-degrading membrane proteinase PrsW (M82 family)
MDKRVVLTLFSAMAQSEEKLVSPLSLIVDLVLVVAFFAYIFTLLRSHVPSNDPKMVTLWAALGTSCMTGVFWLAIQMFRVVFRFQRQSGR